MSREDGASAPTERGRGHRLSERPPRPHPRSRHNEDMRALDGILVADFSRVLAGPLAAMTLGDFGADVIKVEPPAGDETRSWQPPTDDEGRATYFLTVNRNKSSVTLNLKDQADLALARELGRRADVLIENFRPGTMERFGLGHADLAPGNPGLVYGTITGFGEAGGAALPGYDPLVQALSGLMSVTGPADGDASKVGVALVDVIAGQNMIAGVLAALRVRDRTGKGQRVEVDLLSTALAALANQSSSFLNTGVAPGRLGNVHPSIEPFATYAAADGPLMICAGNDNQFRELAVAIGAADLAADPRFLSNLLRVEHRDELRIALESRLELDSVDYWVRILSDCGVPAGPVNDIGAGFELAEGLGLEPVDEFDQIRTVRSPLRLSETPARTRRRPPSLDEQGDEIRAWLQSGSDRD
jgi:crotonobetainyl-CoA:carnitine CoA-transferase CaiB-like acyl-CoA transferase